MNSILEAWNAAGENTALQVMLACCGARRWAAEMVEQRPISTVEVLRTTADRLWGTMQEQDWLEAFACHPRIGGGISGRKPAAVDAQTAGKSAAWSKSAVWSGQEQSRASSAPDSILTELAEGNAQYEQQFGFTYIVCATGKSAEEMLAILKRRLANHREAELREAAEQQRQIMQIRLRKWLVE
jgi:2-oxo-4-hydroxy-4-carboxy-5-ureidoimidazoline decarboxylase